jgi:hypothetical protein
VIQPSVAVVGGGIQGICVALSLARSGAKVTILEAGKALFDRASRRSEGKIHLGFVYANDSSGKTADLMLDAAFRFAPLVDSWIGQTDWQTFRSNPFTYVTFESSLLSSKQLSCHYERIENSYRQNYKNSGLNYLGLVPKSLLTTAASTFRWTDWRPADGTKVADTSEVALDLPRFRNRLCTAVSTQSSISVRLRHRVHEIERNVSGFQLTCIDSNRELWRQDFNAVVNCSWTDRLRLDRQLGIEPNREWVYRLKYRLFGRLEGSTHYPSLTFALGPYGDVVTYPDGRVYVSWYPVCMRGWSNDVAPPSEWEGPCSGLTEPCDSNRLSHDVIREVGEILPPLRKMQVDAVDAGVIFSWGTTDIDCLSSELHSRSEIGVSGGDGYYSINTGKFTCAPLFADQLMTRIRANGDLG